MGVEIPRISMEISSRPQTRSSPGARNCWIPPQDDWIKINTNAAFENVSLKCYLVPNARDQEGRLVAVSANEDMAYWWKLKQK